MRIVAKLLFCILLFSFIPSIEGQDSSSSTNDPVFINFVSTIASSTTSTLTGSYQGGTSLYIQGFGFDSTFENNVIYVGNTKCQTTAKGVTQNNIVCITGAYTSGPTSNLPITIEVLNKQPYTCSTSACLFSYSTSQTPTLNAIYPRSSAGNKILNFYGIHRIISVGDGRDMGDVVGLYIGDSICSLFDVEQRTISASSNSFIACSLTPTQEGGYYSVKQWVTPGIARNTFKMRYASVLKSKQNFDFIVNPSVTGLNLHNAGSKGANLIITGTGFSSNMANVQVVAAGIPCTVVSSTANQITCKVEADNGTHFYGRYSTNLTTPANQVGGYISGSGLAYERYEINALDVTSTGDFKIVLADPDARQMIFKADYDDQITPKVRGDLQTPDIFYEQYYAQTLKGFFLPPVTGSYIFRALGQESLQMNIASATGTKVDFTPTDFRRIYSSSYNINSGHKSNYFYYNSKNLSTDPIDMVAGEAYYLQVYHCSNKDTGFFKIAAEIPNTDPDVPNQVYEVQKVTFGQTVVPEKLEFVINNWSTGNITFKMLIIDPKTLVATYNVSATMLSTGSNKDAGVFKTLLTKFAPFAAYDPVVTGQYFDSNNNSLNSAVGAFKIIYTVEMKLYRPDTYTSATTQYKFTYDTSKASNTVNPSNPPSVSSSVIQQHSPPIGGTYTLSVDGQLLSYTSGGVQTNDIAYDASTSTLAGYFANSPFFKRYVEVDVMGPGYVNGNTNFFSFVGFKGDLNPIVIDTSKMTGGAVGTSITATVVTLRDGSTNILMDPINSEVLGTYSDKPSVLVSVNGIRSMCYGDCSYQVVPTLTPILNSASLTDNVLTLDITTDATLEAFDVQFGGQICTYDQSTTTQLSAYKCTLPYTGTVSAPLLEAGVHVPTVHIPGKGYADNTNVANQINYDLTISTITPDTGNVVGGLTVTLTGTGFPYDSSKTFTVKICNSVATVLSVSNTQIKFITRPCGTTDPAVARVDYGSKFDEAAFTYTNEAVTVPTLTAISPSSYSPVLKGFMIITGTGFGINKNDLTVWLQQSGSNKYQLNIIDVSDTQLKVRIPGGQASGEFRVIVTRQGFGAATANPVDANIFKYQILVNSISPSTGSVNGGTVITITGENFSSQDLQNQVYIGNALNWNCAIISFTTTEIKCRTPPKHSTYTTNNQPVVVVGRAMIDSTCGGTNCDFTYDSTNVPTATIVSPKTSYKAGDSVTLSGTRFINNPTTPVAPIVTVGGKTATLTSYTETEIVFVFPALENGTYALNVNVDGVGYASPTFAVDTLISVSSVSPASGSYVANTIKLIGNGLGDIGNKYVSFNAISSVATTVPFRYKVRSDNTPTSFGIDFEGCSNGATITLNYYYKNTLYKQTYACQTSLTQVVTIPGTKTFGYSDASKVVTFNRTSLSSHLPVYFAAYPVDTTGARVGEFIPLTPTSGSNGLFTADLASLTNGKYGFRSSYSTTYGSADFKDLVEITQAAAPVLAAASVNSGFGGGARITVTGTGLSEFSKLTVAGIHATLVKPASTTSLVYTVPPLVTASTQSQFKITQESVLKGTPFGDTAVNQTNAFDKLISTKYSSSAATCYIGLDFGASQQAQITRIRYFPNSLWKSALTYIAGATIKASVDGSSYDLLTTIDSTTHTGWNIWKPQIPLTTNYRYVRFEHNSTSKCQLAEFQVSGYLYAGVVADTTSETRDVKFTDGVHSTDFTGAVIYKSASTPVITTISPKYGSPAGGQALTITGTGFGTVTTDVIVTIDGIDCSVSTATDTQIVCTTGARPTLPTANSFVVSVSGNVATAKTNSFLYAHRWSSELTWGGDFAPVQGDTVYVPKGMVLLVDQTTPNLYLILVEGAIVFADEADYVVQTTFLIVENGIFRAGTQAEPYQHKLTFILHGDYYDTQLPGFGNKVIGCHSCTFDMHGKVRDHTWTELQSTVAAGDTQIYLMTEVDWVAGEQIVIASTGFDHRQAEQRTIKTISADRKKITFDKPLVYGHIAVVETLSASDEITMRAEVGLLSRNIKVKGDSYSEAKQYGAHVMMHGPASDGLVGRISYTEFTHCGQPKIVGRYCMHFHMNGDVSNSFVRGNAVHHSFARVLTIHAVYYLTVEYNVGYKVSGHNIFLQDGIEQYNVIQYNLMVSSLQVFNMLQTDISVASYWITNPLNTVRFNRAAGSDFYGLWYEIKKNPDGASATTDICPTGLPLGQCHDNVAHSNMRFGLRIFQLWSSQNPCKAIRNAGKLDPWEDNPSIQNRFYNHALWRNAEDGLLAEQIGNTIFQNFVVADNARAGLEFYKTNFTKESVVAKNFIVVGRSENNGMPLGNFTGTSGLITSRTDGSEYQNIRFYNFPEGSTVISVGSKNEQMTLRATGCKNYNFSQVSMTGIQGNYLNYIYTRRYILHDLDGSFSQAFDGQTRANAVITPYYPHNEITGKCSNSTDQPKWSDSLICNAGVVVTDLQFAAAQPASMFFGVSIFIKRLTSDLQEYNKTDTPADTISGSWVQKTDPEQMNTWGLPFVSGYTYSVYWSTGIDWTSITMNPSFYFQSTDDAFIIRFNYTTHRELFDIGHILAGKLQTPLLTAQGNMLTYSSCSFGDYYLDVSKQFLFVCVSGKGKAIYDLLNLNGVACRYLCPKPGGFVKENFIRMWSNVTQWPNGVLPKAGDNITVNGNWTVLLDVDVIDLDNITIDGDIYSTDANRKVSANFIWIRYGSLNVGNSSTAFQYNFTITLNGPKNARTYTVDPILSVNKYLVVTGTLNLYGIVPSTVSTRLTAIATAGSTTITVASASGWVVGNTLGIAPSFGTPTEYQSVTISAISGNTITFTPALKYNHYGDSSAFTNSYGTIDMRASVGLFERNIQILSGADANGWGYGVLMYAWNDGQNIIAGNGVINGVQFVNGGQYDTLNAAFGIINTGAATVKTTLYGSSFQNCGAYCFIFSNVNNATIENNYAYVGKKFIAYAENVRNYNFINNVLVGASKRPSMVGSLTGDDMACYSQYTSLDWANDYVVVENNYCQGSALTGFEFPHTPCQSLGSTNTSRFTNNVAGSTKVGFLLSGGMDCAGGEKLRVYSSEVGIVTNPKAKAFVWNNLMIVDTARGVGLRFGGYDQNNNSMIVKNSFISAVSRPTCSVCYGDDTTPCKNMRAVRLLASSENTENLPKTFGDGFQTICKAQLFDSQAWIYNVTFDNYKTSYTGALSSKCGNNMLFEAHPIDDSSIGNHHFFNTTCTNCDTNALGHYDPPIEKHFGWLGGCGNFPCSGRSNYIMYDHDGSLLGFKGIIIPNNSVIGDNTPGCTYNSVINGHICNRSDFARLKYTSIAPDFDSRMTWPVNLTYEGGNWTTSTNGWREWAWDGDEPLNKRKGRFLSIVQLSKIYNMSFDSQPPTDMLFSFSLPSWTGDNTQWVGIKIYYPVPNAITVTHSNGSATKSIIASDTDNITNYVDKCGTNKYFYKNNTIHFIVTADVNCKVRVTLTSSVQVTARLSVSIDDFYGSNGITTFLDQMTAFLNIPTNRLKIVGVYSGSTVVDAVIIPPPVDTDNSGTVVPNDTALVAELRNLAARIASAGPADLPGLPSFLGATSTVNVMSVSGEVVQDQVVTPDNASTGSQNTKFIIIGVVVGVVGAALVGLSIYLIVKKVRSRNPILPQDSTHNLGQQASKDVIRQENRSQFQLRQHENEPQQLQRQFPNK